MSPPPSSSASFATLAACQANGGAAPVGVALRIVVAVARTAEGASEASISSARVLLGYDGSVSLDAGPSTDRGTAYRSPEQVTGGGVDARSAVFSLGVVLWELLTGTALFHRATEAATAAAILNDPPRDPRSLNGEVPEAVADIVMTALTRDAAERFADAAALAGALAASRVAQASADDLSRWVAQRAPRAPRAQGTMDAVPDLDMPSARSVPVVPPSSPTSVRTAAAAAFSDLALAAPHPEKSVAISTNDDEDFDMQIERNLTSGSGPTATSTRPSASLGLDREGRRASDHELRPSRPPAARSGLDLGAPQRLSARRERDESEDEVGFGAVALGFAVALVVAGLAAGGLFRTVHRAEGQSLTGLLPHAFDGSSATESGAVALMALVVAVTILFVGLRLRPHAWSIVVSGGTWLLLALAMVTVTLASTGENPTPPDGVLLVPYVTPLALALLALGLVTRGGRILARSYGWKRGGGIPLALLGGALGFVAFEVSRLAGML